MKVVFKTLFSILFLNFMFIDAVFAVNSVKYPFFSKSI
jgi:hypothetical protein